MILIVRLNFVDDQEIEMHHLGIAHSGNAWDPISEEVVLEALGLILDKRNYPLMVMCNLGRHRTPLPPCMRLMCRNGNSRWMSTKTTEMELGKYI